jgi:carbamoyl-phosphate synthase large subunit
MVEVTIMIAACYGIFTLLIDPVRTLEARASVWVLQLFGITSVSAIVAPEILVFPADGVPVTAVVTASCSALASVLALTALSAGVLRSRKGHTFLAIITAGPLIFLANVIRMVLSLLAGIEYGRSGLVLFHDWVGALLNFAYTLIGFLLLLYLTLPTAERAEQDRFGRHTARRPGAWARPGLGYRVPELEAPKTTYRKTLTGLLMRRLVPKPLAKRAAARRESKRVDYRLGHMSEPERIARITELLSEGLGAHAATLVAVAKYDESTMVKRHLADGVATRAWEPGTSDDVDALRLWAHGWHEKRVDLETAQAQADGGQVTSEDASAEVAVPAVAGTVVALSASAGGVTEAVRGEVPTEAPGAPAVVVEEGQDQAADTSLEGVAVSADEVSPAGGAFVEAAAEEAVESGGTESTGKELVASASSQELSTVPVSTPVESAETLRKRLFEMSVEELAHSTKRRVLVTGAGGPAGLSVVRHLMKKGHYVIAADAAEHCAAERLADAWVRIPLGTSQVFGDAILRVVKTHKPDALICTVDEEMPALVTVRAGIEALGTGVWIPEAETVRQSSDKLAFAKLMVENRISHPSTFMGNTEIKGEGPWVVKPRKGRGSRDVRVVETTAEAQSIAGPGDVVQACLVGREFTADAFRSRRGELLVCSPRWRDEVSRGLSVEGTTFSLVEVDVLVERTLAALNLTGPANVQGFVAADGTVTIMEVNPRFSGGLPLTLEAGADTVGLHLAGTIDPRAELPSLVADTGVRMMRYYSEVFDSVR